MALSNSFLSLVFSVILIAFAKANPSYFGTVEIVKTPETPYCKKAYAPTIFGTFKGMFFTATSKNKFNKDSFNGQTFTAKSDYDGVEFCAEHKYGQEDEQPYLVNWAVFNGEEFGGKFYEGEAKISSTPTHFDSVAESEEDDVPMVAVMHCAGQTNGYWITKDENKMMATSTNSEESDIKYNVGFFKKTEQSEEKQDYEAGSVKVDVDDASGSSGTCVTVEFTQPYDFPPFMFVTFEMDGEYTFTHFDTWIDEESPTHAQVCVAHSETPEFHGTVHYVAFTDMPKVQITDKAQFMAVMVPFVKTDPATYEETMPEIIETMQGWIEAILEKFPATSPDYSYMEGIVFNVKSSVVNPMATHVSFETQIKEMSQFIEQLATEFISGDFVSVIVAMANAIPEFQVVVEYISNTDFNAILTAIMGYLPGPGEPIDINQIMGMFQDPFIKQALQNVVTMLNDMKAKASHPAYMKTIGFVVNNALAYGFASQNEDGETVLFDISQYMSLIELGVNMVSNMVDGGDILTEIVTAVKETVYIADINTFKFEVPLMYNTFEATPVDETDPPSGETPPPGDETGATPPPGDETGATPPPGGETEGSPPPEGETGATPPPEGETGATPPPEGETGATPPPEGETGATPPPEGNTGETPTPEGDTGATPPPEGETGGTPPPGDEAQTTESPTRNMRQLEENTTEDSKVEVTTFSFSATFYQNVDGASSTEMFNSQYPTSSDDFPKGIVKMTSSYTSEPIVTDDSSDGGSSTIIIIVVVVVVVIVAAIGGFVWYKNAQKKKSTVHV